MSAIIIRNIPPYLHGRLRQDAVLNHRSLTRHVIALLEEAVENRQNPGIKKPSRTTFKSTPEFIARAKRMGRQ